MAALTRMSLRISYGQPAHLLRTGTTRLNNSYRIVSFFINWYKFFFYYFFNPRCVRQSIVVTVTLLCFAGITFLISHEFLVATYIPSTLCILMASNLLWYQWSRCLSEGALSRASDLEDRVLSKAIWRWRLPSWTTQRRF